MLKTAERYPKLKSAIEDWPASMLQTYHHISLAKPASFRFSSASAFGEFVAAAEAMRQVRRRA